MKKLFLALILSTPAFAQNYAPEYLLQELLEREYQHAADGAITLKIVLEEIQKGNLSTELRGHFCYSLGRMDVSSSLVLKVLGEIDRNDEMLLKFPKRVEYLNFKNLLREASLLGGVAECLEFLKAADANAMKDLLQRADAYQKKILNTPNGRDHSDVMIEFLDYAATWKP